MKRELVVKLGVLILVAGQMAQTAAQIVHYPWPLESELISSAKYEIRARTYDPESEGYGEWEDLTVFLSYPRSYPAHWKCGTDHATGFLKDRTLSFVSIAFTGTIELEVTQKLSDTKARRVEIAPKALGIDPNYFDGNKVRFLMDQQHYVSVNFDFGTGDQLINRDDNRAGGFDIRHGCMILAELPEQELPEGYTIPQPTDDGVVMWNNNVDLSTIRNADIIYFPPGEHHMRDHKDRWERNSSWEKSEAEGNWVTTATEYNSAHLYRGRLFLGKDNQKVYLAPGAIVYGGFHSKGKNNNWLYGRGIVTGRKHLMHEIVTPVTKTIPVDQPYELVTQTKEAFCHFGTGAVYDGVLFLEAWHHTCPSGQNTTIKRTKIIGWCSNNDGIRPSSNSNIDKIFIKTSDDYDYARDKHTVKNGVFWPMVNGAVGQLGWNDLGSGYAEYYNMQVINAEWHLSDFSKTNVGIINGGKADAGIKLQDNIYQDIHIENRTNYLVAVALEGSSTATGYLRNFLVKNVTTEYPFSNPAGVAVKQELAGKNNSWVEGWIFTNVFINGVLLTWENYKDYFNLNLVGTNGNNSDDTKKTRNITFNSEGPVYSIAYTKNEGGNIWPAGNGSVIRVAGGMNQTVTIKPNDGYRIKMISVDGEVKYRFNDPEATLRKQAWIFENISTDHSIDVEFEAGDDYFDLHGTLSSDNKLYVINVFGLFPNPSTGLINIHIPGKSEASVRIINSGGSVVKTAKIPGGSTELCISELEEGIYLLEIHQEKVFYTGKFIKTNKNL